MTAREDEIKTRSDEIKTKPASGNRSWVLSSRVSASRAAPRIQEQSFRPLGEATTRPGGDLGESRRPTTADTAIKTGLHEMKRGRPEQWSSRRA